MGVDIQPTHQIKHDSCDNGIMEARSAGSWSIREGVLEEGLSKLAFEGCLQDCELE